MPIKIIQGKPGTGKSYTLALIYKQFVNDCVILCFTHSNVNIFKQTYNIENCFTIHSFFKANYKNKVKKLVPIKANYILVDEFTLIPDELLKVILKYSSNHNIILSGDILQLSSINNSTLNFNHHFNFDISNLTVNEVAKIYFKLSNSIYSKSFYLKSDQMILKKNYRSESKVMKILSEAMNDKIELMNVNDLIKKIKYKKYVVISSRYKWLKYVNELVYSLNDDCIKTMCGMCDKKQKFIMCETLNKNLVNGQIVEYDEIKNLKLDKLPILPLNFITAHKAQGNSYDKVVCILDDHFDISILYTMISRARLNVKFYICSMNSDKVMNEIKSNNKCLKIIESLIYNQ